MRVSLKTEKRRSQQTPLVCHCPVFGFRPRVSRAEVKLTTEQNKMEGGVVRPVLRFIFFCNGQCTLSQRNELY